MKKYTKEIACLVVMAILVVAMILFGYRDTLDTRLFYSADDALSFFTQLSSANAERYLRNEIFDLGFIWSYTRLLELVVRRLFPPRMIWFAYLPALFDLIETGTIIYLLNGLEDPPTYLGYATLLKWLSTFLLTAMIGVQLFKRRGFRLSST